jgi:MoaA/NifB/PqqE/SkfB family radical SAM enzyme
LPRLDTTDERLDLSRKLRQESLAGRLRAISTGQPVHAPVVVELDPTTFCDLACPECISGALLNNGGFKADRLRALAEEMADAGVSAVILIGGGEPLLHPAVGDVIEVLAAASVRIGITTNGTQIHRHLETIARDVTWTRVSVDAGSAECYARFRPSKRKVNVFPDVIANMKLLADKKTGALGYSYLLMSRRDGAGVVTEANFHDVYAAAALAREIGCDYFEVKPEYDMAHYLMRQDEQLVDSLLTQLDEASSLETEGFSVIFPAHLQDVVRGEALVQPKEYDWCPIAELRTLITPTGAYICPYHRGKPEAKYGDPATTSFRDLWLGPERGAVVARIKPSRDCGFHCIRHRSNLDLLELKERGVDNLPSVADYDIFI